MPLYEHSCVNKDCKRFGAKQENYFSSMDCKNPQCCQCGGATNREISMSSVIWARGLSSYNNPHLEGARDDGFWTTRRDEQGRVHRHYIDSIQGVKEHAKATGSISPLDLPSNITGVGSTGKTLETTGCISEL